MGGLNGLSPNDLVSTICSDPDGNIYAAGVFTNDSGNYYVAKYTNSATGINEISTASTVQAFPNPVTETLYFSGVKYGNKVEVYNLLGENIQTSIATNDNYTVNTNSFAIGVYFYRVTDISSGVHKGTFIKN